MFTLATAFLIFGQSAFQVISAVILDVALQIVGADVLATSFTGFIDEGPIREFLTNQQNQEDQPVWDFTFASASY